MTQFPGARQPALGIQDAVMLPAQTAGNLLIQRLAAAEAAFVPTTQTFDSTTSSTTLNSTRASSGGGSLRSLMIPVDTTNFQAITPSQSAAFYNGPQFAQFGNQELVAAIIASQTRQGSAAGRAILNACGIDFPSGGCGCTCTRELSEEVVIDEENSNGIDDGDEMVLAEATKAVPVTNTVPVVTPSATAAVPVVTVPAAAAPAAAVPVTVAEAAAPAAPTANVQYVTYNA